MDVARQLETGTAVGLPRRGIPATAVRAVTSDVAATLGDEADPGSSGIPIRRAEVATVRPPSGERPSSVESGLVVPGGTPGLGP